MLRILGSRRRLCDGWSRREFIRASTVGSLASLASSAGRSGAAQTVATSKAKACILLYLYGSPSQLETFDVKPDAPQGIRGDLGTTATSIPGFRIGELLPEIKPKSSTEQRWCGRWCIPTRYMELPTQPVGFRIPVESASYRRRDPAHWPFIGSVVDYLEERRAWKEKALAIPNNIAFPWPLSTRRANQPHRSGPYGGFLGPAYDPIWTEFHGEGTKVFTQENRGVVQEFRDPYSGIRSDGRFEIASGEGANESMTLDRLDKGRDAARATRSKQERD